MNRCLKSEDSYVTQSDLGALPCRMGWNLTGQFVRNFQRLSQELYGCQDTVSYTHLDVYKRQVLLSMPKRPLSSVISTPLRSTKDSKLIWP